VAIPLIRPATVEDLPALLEIERECFSQPHWTLEDFRKYNCIVAEVEQQIAGFLVFRETYPGDITSLPEREVLNVAVASNFRRQSIATHLMRHFLSCRAVYFLEVRESNIPAQKLYRKLGFTEVARRPQYYESPIETAIVMKMKWC
jgi:ribosomal-protein-alanine N-acetyltransferase